MGRGVSVKPRLSSVLTRLFVLEMATWHSGVLATCHIGITGVRATCHARGSKRTHKSERHNRRKAQDACCDVFHTSLLIRSLNLRHYARSKSLADQRTQVNNPIGGLLVPWQAADSAVVSPAGSVERDPLEPCRAVIDFLHFARSGRCRRCPAHHGF